MPGVNSKERAIFLTVGVAACTGGLLGIGVVLLYQRLRRDARGFVEDLRRDVVALRRELEDLRRLVDDSRRESQVQSAQPFDALAAVEDADRLVSKRPSTTSSSQDEAEFYDANSEQNSSDYQPTSLPNSMSNGHIHSPNENLEILFSKITTLLAIEDETAAENRKRAYELLKECYEEHESNYEYLWRFSRVTYLYGRTLTGTNEAKRKELCFEAKDHAFRALDLNSESADVHKWCALTLGTLGDFVSINQKIKDGWTFKVHIDTAINLRSEDATLRHLSGRWLFSVAGLSWWERKLANAIFSTEIPAATYDEAVDQFLHAERLKPKWKENILYIALCYHNKGDKAEARRYLEKARDMMPESVDDITAEEEIEKLWRNYYK